MSERRFTIAALGLACLLAASAAPPVAAQQAAPPPAVLVEPAEQTPIADQAEFIGRAAAVDKVDLRARVKGFLGPRKFKDGDNVKKDEIVFTIEPETYQAAVDQKKAQRDSAQAALTNADLQLSRAAELLRTNTGTKATYDQRLSEQLQARANLDDAEAQLQEAELQLSWTEIKAPIGGLIGRAMASPGNIVGPETGLLATIVNERRIRAFFSVPQADLLSVRRDLRAGAPLAVQLRLADGKLYAEKGKVDFIDVEVDPATDGQAVRAVFENADELLTDGQTVRVIVEGNAPEKVLAIPQPALAIDQTGPYVYVVDSRNIVEQRRIGIGFIRDGLIAVTSGLKDGEEVVVQGQQRVRPGATVETRPVPRPAGR